MKNLQSNFVAPSQNITEAIKVIERSKAKIGIIVDEDHRLLGTVTDGDIRRAILKGSSLDDPVETIMNASPRTARVGDDREGLIDLMRRNVCRHIPILDEDGKVVKLETLQEFVDYEHHENFIVLMAGGQGKRLRPLTKTVPKPMLPVGGSPILELILQRFRDQGFGKFFISVNYLGHMIQDHFGDGKKWGVNIEYMCEKQQLGTGGALSLLPQRPKKPIIVMNGDILTKVDFRQLLEFHEEHKAQVTMCVRDYMVEIPFGVIDNDGHRIRQIREKPTQNFLVNAGVYVLEPDVLDLIPRDEFFDMPTLIDDLIKRGQHVCLFPLREYWIDIGRHDELDKAMNEFSEEFSDEVAENKND